MLKTIKLPFSSESINLGKGQDGNKVSILIGENGTRKSFLLRHILEDGVVKIKGKEKQIRNVFSFSPSKIIALSALPSDRFPPKNNHYDRPGAREYDIDEYIYIGPRTAINIVSRNQSANELISSILSNPDVLKEKGAFISEICKKIDVSTNFSFHLRVSPNFEIQGATHRLTKSLKARAQKNSGTSPIDPNSISEELEQIRVLLSEVAAHVLQQRTTNSSKTSKFPQTIFKVWIDLERGQIDYGGIDPLILEQGFKYGILKASRIIFDEEKSQEELSAGQWATFSSLSSVALSVQDRSLLLIDEPENGLHPLWQREYVRNILSAIDHVKECQVVIATHSPLILSSLPLANSDCVVLKNTNGKITASIENSPSGWDSNSLLEGVFSLESSRGPEVTDLVNSALKMISLGIADNKNELKSLRAELKAYGKNLPDTDILKEVISSIIELSK